jgi:hypothetical protein
VGKTTKLREVARVLDDGMNKRVVIVDTSNEIGGDGDVPHAAIGGARRMQVAHPDQQHATMIEAVENHMPEVIVVDEIGTLHEALAARTIAERGVQLIGTAHGNTLKNIVLNPTLCDLVGGVQTVILGDEEARFRGTQKTVLERKAPPTFDAVVEIVGHDEVVVHPDTAQAVDRLLQGKEPGGLRRTPERETPIETTEVAPAAPERVPAAGQRATRIYPYALSPDSVERVIRDLGVTARTVSRPEHADMIVALRGRGDDLRLQRIARATGVPVHAIKKNSTAQIRHALRDVFHVMHGVEDAEVQDAVREAEDAVQRVIAEGVEVTLTPRRPALRKIQHRIVARHHLDARSEGREPRRHLVVLPVTA